MVKVIVTTPFSEIKNMHYKSKATSHKQDKMLFYQKNTNRPDLEKSQETFYPI